MNFHEIASNHSLLQILAIFNRITKQAATSLEPELKKFMLKNFKFLSYNEAIELAPNDPQVYFRKGSLFHGLAEYEIAIIFTIKS